MSGRRRDLDMLKGWGILLMVFDHVGWGGTVHTYIQSFHMPLFFIVSGYLWSGSRDLRSLAKRRFDGAMVPYLTFSMLYMLMIGLGNIFGLSSRSILYSVRAVLFFPTDMDAMPLAPALWFLLCFFLANLAYGVLEARLGERKWVAVVAIAMAGIAYSCLSDVMLPFCLEPVAVAILFMLIGQAVREHEGRLFDLLGDGRVLLLLLIAEACLAFVNGSVDMRSARYHNVILYVLNSVAGTLAWWAVARRLPSKAPNLAGGVVLPQCQLHCLPLHEPTPDSCNRRGLWVSCIAYSPRMCKSSHTLLGAGLVRVH